MEMGTTGAYLGASAAFVGVYAAMGAFGFLMTHISVSAHGRFGDKERERALDEVPSKVFSAMACPRVICGLLPYAIAAIPVGALLGWSAEKIVTTIASQFGWGAVGVGSSIAIFTVLAGSRDQALENREETIFAGPREESRA